MSDNFDSADYEGDTGGMEVAFKFLMHEYYSRDLSKKIKSAKYEKMRRGEAVTKYCLFGYKLNDKRQMIIDEPAAETVRLIFDFALEEKSLAGVAKRLYDEMRPKPREYKQNIENPTCIWDLATIRQILIDEQYTGMYIAGRTRNTNVGSKQTVSVPESEWVKIPDHHPAIVDKSLFDKARAAIIGKVLPKTNRKMGTAERYRNIDKTLNGKVVCGCCGHTMRLSSTTNARYHCNFTRVAVDAECYHLSVSASELREMLFDVISKQAQVVLNVESLGDIHELDLRLECQSDYKKQIEHLGEEKRRLYERFILGEFNADEYKTEKSNIDVQLAHLIRVSVAHTTETATLTEEKSTNDKLRRIAETVSHENKLTRSLADLLIDKVLIFPGNEIACNRVEIEWKISDFICGNTVNANQLSIVS